MSPLARPGSLIGARYLLDHVVDFGGMGVIWRATHTALGQVVAIKLMPAQHACSSGQRNRFAREARAAARLRSRYVVQVSDYGELDDGTPYIVMEYLEGEALDRRIHRDGPLGVDETTRVVVHIGRALSVAHAAGIVHRDIKPENIFLADTGDEDDFIAKVLDFGVARMGVDQLATSTTRQGALIGTPRYMSPEQARGSTAVDFRTDLYSLGAVTYTILTGRVLFDASTLGEIVWMTCQASLPSILERCPWLPAEVDTWFHRACARDPEARFESAQQMIDSFCQAAGSPPPPRNSIPIMSPEPSGAEMLTLLPAGPTGFDPRCATTVQDVTPPCPRSPTHALPRSRARVRALWIAAGALALAGALSVGYRSLAHRSVERRAFGEALVTSARLVLPGPSGDGAAIERRKDDSSSAIPAWLEKRQ